MMIWILEDQPKWLQIAHKQATEVCRKLGITPTILCDQEMIWPPAFARSAAGDFTGPLPDIVILDLLFHGEMRAEKLYEELRNAEREGEKRSFVIVWTEWMGSPMANFVQKTARLDTHFVTPETKSPSGLAAAIEDCWQQVELGE